MGSIWDGFGRDLEALGASWAVLVPLFFMLVFGVVFKSALGGIRAGFCFDFEGFGMDFGRVLGSFRGFWVILDCSELFCVIGAF